MTGNRTQAERALAVVIHEIRDEWDVAGITAALRRCSERPMADAAAAAIYAAVHRVDLRSPEPIARDGEHWRALERMASTKPAVVPPSHADGPRCRVCGRTKDACRKADSLAPTHDFEEEA